MFLNVMNKEEKTKNMEYIQDILLRSIKEVRPWNVGKLLRTMQRFARPQVEKWR